LPGSEIIQLSVAGGSLFSLAVLVGVAQVGGWALALLGAPPLLGMLLAGILIQNIPFVGTELGESCCCSLSVAFFTLQLTIVFTLFFFIVPGRVLDLDPHWIRIFESRDPDPDLHVDSDLQICFDFFHVKNTNFWKSKPWKRIRKYFKLRIRIRK